MLVAVTGATGFIGRHLVAHLTRRGVTVRAVVRPRPSLPRFDDAPGAAVVAAPLETAQLLAAFRGAEVVVHLAGVVSSVHARDYTSANVNGTRAVAEAAAFVGARLIHISSLAVAGPSCASAPLSEDDEPAPITAYGRSKLEGEQVVRSVSGLRWTILRPGVVYGPGDRAMLPLFQWARLGVLPVVGRPDGAYTFVHVADAVRAIDAAIGAGADGDVLFVGHPQVVTTTSVLSGIQTALGTHSLTIRIPNVIAWPAAIVAEGVGRVIGTPLPLNLSRFDELSASGFVCCVDRLRDHLQIVADIDLSAGLADTAAWYAREKWL